ncbi:MAG: type II toxin-antitoxin system HicB family antitoxin [Acidobacteria bacterium]|nr:type II toxin-antitoxin system HicB family antitoxin [Acidobacteriota bacterium]
MPAKFTLEYWMDEGWFVGRLVEVDGVFSQAESLEELEDNIREVYRLMQDTRGLEIPLQSHRKEILVEA